MSGVRSALVVLLVVAAGACGAHSVRDGSASGGRHGGSPSRAEARLRREDTTAATECRALRSTVRLPQAQWANGIFAIAAEGTPPAFAAAITQMELAVGDSYGPQLSSATVATIASVGRLCAEEPIDVTGIRV